MGLSLDRLIFGPIICLALIPFNQLYLLRLGFVTLGLHELAIITIGVLSTVIILCRGARTEFLGMLLVWVFLSIGFFLMTPLINGARYTDAFRQIRSFLPFSAAMMLLVTPLRGSVEKALMLIVGASGVGALVAIIIHFVFPAILETALASNQEAVAISVVHGRLCWSNAVLTFVALAYLATRQKRDAFLYICCLLCVFGVLLTLNRTLPPFLVLFYVVAQYFVRKKVSKTFAGLAALSLGAGVLIFWFADDRYFDLFSLRFLGHGSLASIYERSILYGRALVYERYLGIVMDTFPIGQGLGVPYFRTFVRNVYITDNSFLAFVLPFGVLGASFFLYFIKNLWGASDKRLYGTEYDINLACVLRIMIVMLLLVSLNIDVFSRNNMTVILAFLMSLLSSKKANMFGPPTAHGQKGCND
ncbi:MAG: hypothetical protein SWQ30_03940 [Thermodesulfobacteriota bacterium]|nr:hypothetical protein [Thermodesulfobacteriota bacterium]